MTQRYPFARTLSLSNANTNRPQCYLCPSNTRANGEHNPKFDKTFVFVNDYSAVMEEQQEYDPSSKDGSLASRLLRAEAVTGKCYVICFSPSHNLTLADMSPAQIVPIIETWTNIYVAHLDPKSPLAKLASATTLPPLSQGTLAVPNAQYRYMQIFENKGTAMGCSNPHPHGQVWTTTSLPEEPALELVQLSKYRKEQGGAHMLVIMPSWNRKRRPVLFLRTRASGRVCLTGQCGRLRSWSFLSSTSGRWSTLPKTSEHSWQSV
jgi:galactose-1-phosphate uridylyltransferase (family 1)